MIGNHSHTKHTARAVVGSDPSSLSSIQRGILSEYWRSRGVGEMGAELAFSGLTRDLEALGAPSELVVQAQRATEDERKHGLWGRDWAVFFGHPFKSTLSPRDTCELTFPRASARENRVLRVAFFAMLETCGCHVLDIVRPRLEYQPLVRNNRAHLSDEVRHARLCWAYLATIGHHDRALLAHYLPLMLRLLPQAVVDGPESDEHDQLVPFGYLTPKVLRRGHEQAVSEVILPGMEALGIIATARGAA